MRNNLFEAIVGTFVLLTAIYFFVFSFKQSDISTKDSYQISAEFDNMVTLAMVVMLKFLVLKLVLLIAKF